MKTLNKTIFIIFILCTILSLNAYALDYSYNLDGANGDYVYTDYSKSKNGNAENLLKMKLKLEGKNIIVKVEKKDGSRFSEGNIYLQTNSNSNDLIHRIECTEDSYINGDSSRTLIPLESLDYIQANWKMDRNVNYDRGEALIYVIYETDGDESWVGPVVIERISNLKKGSIQVELNPMEARNAGASWRIEISENNQWSPWYKSSDIV